MRVQSADDVVANGEEGHRADREEQRERANVLGAVPLRGEGDRAADDRERPEDEQGAHRLVQEEEGERHRHERGGAHGHRRPRGAGLAHREREQHLRAAGGEQARKEEFPAAMKVVLRQGGATGVEMAVAARY